jgi:copper chaperone
MTSTTLSVPEIHCGHCKEAIEGAVGPLTGVQTVEVDVDARRVHVQHDDAVTVRALVDAIEDQGYEVPEQAGTS